MELPLSLLSDSACEGNLYFFTEKCPIGIKGHIHICIKVGDEYLLFNTCTSQTNTVYNQITFFDVDPNTFPCIKSDDLNKFQRDLTYVNCNDVTLMSKEKFSDYLSKGIIYPLDGIITEEQIQSILKGVHLSKYVSAKIKKLLDF